MKTILLITLFCLNTIAGDLTDTSKLFVPLNKTEALPFSPYQPIHITNAVFAKIREHQGRLLITGTKEGETTLTIGKKKHTLHVLDEAKIKSYHKLISLTQNMLGLKVDILDKEVYLTGKLLRFSDWLKITKTTVEGKLPFVLSAQFNDEIHKKLDQHLISLIENSQLPLISISLSPEAAAIIPTNLKAHMDRYKELLTPIGVKLVEDKNALSLEPVIDLSVQIVELKKSSFSKIGVDLPLYYKAQVLPHNKFKTQFSNFEVALSAMESNGEAKILASPHLSCRSGKEASFLAGGEFPIKIMNFHTNDIQWKKHGILLNFKPLADRSGKMSFYLKAEISTFDKSQSVDGIPGVLVNRVESHLDLLDSQTIALSGLIKKQTGTSKQGLPGLKDIPILGLLFSSEDYLEDRTDLVVFVTPKVITEKDYLKQRSEENTL